MKKLLAFALLSLSYLANTAQTGKLPAFVSDSLDQYIARALTEWKIPGVAICIVKDGKTVWSKGYGLRELGKPDRVDENTLFMIGSNTKAFTATAMALLQADGKLSLDDNVQKWLPQFTLFDPWVAREANLRDLLSHRLGFETFQGDFMYFDTDLSKDEVITRFGQVKPAYSFRSKWGYTNAAFAVAGEVIQKASGISWAEFIRNRIFKPLDMSSSLALSAEITKAGNAAAAHTVDAGHLKKIAYGKIDNIAPAGSISSSVADLSHWVLMHLNSGKYNNTTVLPPTAQTQTWLPHSILGNGGRLYNKGHFALYGLGWFLEEYSGRRIVSHTGGVNGFVTSVTLVPEEKLGIVVLTNTDHNNFYEACKWEILDAYLGNPYRNYSKAFLGFAKNEERADSIWLSKKRDTISLNLPPAVANTALTGSYSHPIYGKMNIALENKKLIARFEHHSGRYATLEPLGGTRWLCTYSDAIYGVKVWPFRIENGKVIDVTVTVADFVEFTPYVFTKN